MTRNGSTNGSGNGHPAKFLVEVAPRHGQSDSHSAALLAQLPSLGIAGAKDIRVSSLYEITGALSKSQAQQVSRDLLTDPITQEFRMDGSTPSQAFLVGPHWRVEVWLKASVTDSAGESVRSAVGDLGLPHPERVRTGTAYRILGKLNRGQVDKLLNALLANPLIHRTSVSRL